MTTQELRDRIIKGLEADAGVIALHAVMRAYAEAGGDREGAVQVVEGLRETRKDDEDTVLELLDFATGYCVPAMRIWAE